MDCTADSHHSHVCLLNSISYCPAAQTRKACLVFPNECNTSEQVTGEFDDSGSLKKKKKNRNGYVSATSTNPKSITGNGIFHNTDGFWPRFYM